MAVSLRKKTKLTGNVKIYRTYYKRADVHDGDVPRDDVREDEWCDIHATEAAQILQREGLSFAATGNDWAALPDGSFTVDFGQGIECELSGHLSGFPDRLVQAIIGKVG